MWLSSLALRIALLGVWPVFALASSEASSTGRLGVAHAEATATGEEQALTDRQIKRILIDESIAAYPGNCPCPYNRARNGARCGRRSAYDRAGGEAPLCFERDVTPEMVQRYRDARRTD
jgi:hypothetical protein